MDLKIKSVNWLQTFDNKRSDSVWYGGPIVSIDLGRYQFVIGAYGEVRICLDDEYYADKNNGGSIADVLVDNDIVNDKDLGMVSNSGRLEWLNNNWYEFSIYDKEQGVYLDVDGLMDDNLDANDDFAWVLDVMNEVLDDED